MWVYTHEDKESGPVLPHFGREDMTDEEFGARLEAYQREYPGATAEQIAATGLYRQQRERPAGRGAAASPSAPTPAPAGPTSTEE